MSEITVEEEKFEWNLKRYEILKAISEGKNQEFDKGEIYVAINERFLKKENEKYELTELAKKFIEWTEKKLKQLNELNKEYLEITREISIEELLKILGITIKYDNINKLVTFLAMLCAYTKESQFNVSFRAPSTTGKSYIPIELAQYFPEQDIIMIAYSSPTAFYHDTGYWDEEKQAIMIDLKKKILIFLDQPHDQLLQRLRPLLSHDKKELLYKVTDKREKRGLRTKNVIIKGWPSVIFCTGSLKVDEQEATRNFILSPETSIEKIREGIYLKALRRGNPLFYKDFINQYRERELLKKRIEKIKESEIEYVIIENIDEVFKKFIEKYPRSKPRHQRDIERIISLIQALALFNCWNRKSENKCVYANEYDIKTAFELFDKISQSQELGIPPFIYTIYQEVIVPLWVEKYRELQGGDGVEDRNREIDGGGILYEKYRELDGGVNRNREMESGVNDRNINIPLEWREKIGLERKEIIRKYFEVYSRPIQDWFLRREILPALESAGLIIIEIDPKDKRKNLIYPTPTLDFPISSPPTVNFPISLENKEQEGGVKEEEISLAERIRLFILDKCKNEYSVVKLLEHDIIQHFGKEAYDLAFAVFCKMKERGEIFDVKLDRVQTAEMPVVEMGGEK